MEKSAVLTIVLLLLLLPPLQGVPHSILPDRYVYQNGSFSPPPATPSTCEVLMNAGVQYLSCAASILTNSGIGPSNFSDASNGDYYTWDSPAQMLFTFSRNITLKNITIYYYFGNGRPKVRFYIVEENFQAWDTVDSAGGISTTFDIVVDDQEHAHRQTSVRSLNGMTTKILMAILSEKNDVVVLSEVIFYANDTVPLDTSSPTAPGSTHAPDSTTSSSESTTQRGRASPSSNTSITLTNGASNYVGAISGALSAFAVGMVAAALVVAGLLLYRKHRATRFRVPTEDDDHDLGGENGDKEKITAL